ncbi:hypothetical protein [Mycolicibacterium thermoresistibile]
MAIPDLKVNENALNWDAAEVTVPPVPPVSGGDDLMSQVIAYAMPDVGATVTEMVEETRAREVEFAAKVEAAKRAYQRTDDSAEEDLKGAEEAVASSSATGDSATTSSGGLVAGSTSQAGGLGQLLGMPMQLGSTAASSPQGFMQDVQSAARQAGQLPGMVGEGITGAGSTDANTDATEPGLDSDAEQKERVSEGSGEAVQERAATAEDDDKERTERPWKQHNGLGGSTLEQRSSVDTSPEIAQ